MLIHPSRPHTHTLLLQYHHALFVPRLWAACEQKILEKVESRDEKLFHAFREHRTD